MATSSITRNFVVEGKEQVQMFANAIEESYQESLVRKEESDIEITYIRGKKALKDFTERWERARGSTTK